MSVRMGIVIRFMGVGVGLLRTRMRVVMCVQMPMLMAVHELPMRVFVCMHVFVSVRTFHDVLSSIATFVATSTVVVTEL
jgi:hypothetical protein